MDMGDFRGLCDRHPAAVEASDSLADFLTAIEGTTDAGLARHLRKYVGGWGDSAYLTCKLHGFAARPLYVPTIVRLADLVEDVRFISFLEGGRTREENSRHVDGRIFCSGLRSGGDVPFGSMGGKRDWSPNWLERGEFIRRISGAKTFGTYARPKPEVAKAWARVIGGEVGSLEFIRWDDGRTLVIASGEQTFSLYLTILPAGECNFLALMPEEDRRLIEENRAAEIAAWGDGSTRRYRLEGEDRQTGAIGAFERFTAEIVAPTEEAARDAVRAMRYKAGREHVHFKTVTALEEAQADA